MSRFSVVRPSMAAVWLAATCITSLQSRAESWPDPAWRTESPRAVGLDEKLLEQARDYALTGGGSGCVIRDGQRVLTWGDQKRRYDLKSTTKSFGATALGVAILDGKISLNDPARKHHPTLGVPPASNKETGWIDKVTIQQLATHTAGFEKPGGYTNIVFEPGEVGLQRWRSQLAGRVRYVGL